MSAEFGFMITFVSSQLGNHLEQGRKILMMLTQKQFILIFQPWDSISVVFQVVCNKPSTL